MVAQVKSALTYPAFLIVALIGLMLLVLLLLVPRIADICGKAQILESPLRTNTPSREANDSTAGASIS